MAAQLGEMAVGSIVKLNENGSPVEFIVVQQGRPKFGNYSLAFENVTWILRKDIHSKRKTRDDGSTGYDVSTIYPWLSNDTDGYLGLLDKNIQDVIPTVKIPYRPGNNESAVKEGENGLSCKVFLLSASEYGGSYYNMIEEGAALEYFENSNDDPSKRISYFNGEATDYYTRTPGSTQRAFGVGTTGSIGEFYSYTEEGIRPAFTLPQTLYVLSDGTITLNPPPTAPASITVPELVKGGGDLLVSWVAASDPDGDPVSYELERKTDAADWAQIYKGEALNFTDQITKGWQSVQYRVRAVDSGNLSSGWTESETRTVDNNTAPAITCEHPGGSDLGEKAEPFAVNYTLTDPDGDPLTLTETVDGQTTRTETEAESGAALTAAVLNDPAEFQKLLNGPHTLTITASDGKAQTTHTLTFTKKVTSASVTLSEPLAVEGDITLAALRVAGSIPEDALFTVEVTNNGADDQPVWQDATAEVKRGANIVFTNHTAAKGAAFNFRVNVSRGPSGEGGYITAITGAFQ